MVDFQSRDTRRGTASQRAATDETADERDAEPADEHADDHRPDAEELTTDDRCGLFVVTVEDGTVDDTADAVIQSLESEARTVVGSERVTAEYDAVQGAIDRIVPRRDVDAVLTVGGTGVSDSDVTVEAVEPLLDKQLPGFGELFRVSYFEHVGADVLAMRPTAGICDGVPVFCLPGDREAATYGIEELVVETVDELLEQVSN